MDSELKFYYFKSSKWTNGTIKESFSTLEIAEQYRQTDLDKDYLCSRIYCVDIDGHKIG